MSSPADMIRTIVAHVADTQRETGRARLADSVLAAMEQVPRDLFVPPDSKHLAWRDSPLPIGAGQTISQPFIVALMTDLIDPQPHHRVLDVGTGCGYQAAILSQLVKQVDSVEIIEELATRASTRLANLGCENVRVHCGDGRGGWPKHAPYDGILVAAAGRGVPDALRRQLRIGGHLVLPVEEASGWQQLQRITRVDEHDFRVEKVLGVRFVPLVGGDSAD